MNMPRQKGAGKHAGGMRASGRARSNKRFHIKVFCQEYGQRGLSGAGGEHRGGMTYKTGVVGSLGNSTKNRSYESYLFIQSLKCAARAGMTRA